MYRLPRCKNWRDVLVLCLLLVSAQQLGGAGVIKAKAWLAPILIASAWEKTLLAGGAPVKPWPWADTWPVARLRVPSQGVDLLVLAGDSGNALAFGPGHTLASAAPGSAGLAVFGGHRDTHFAFLRQLQPDELLQLELPTGEWLDYRVEKAEVVDVRQQSLPSSSTGEALLLVTCFPFNEWRPGGPLRYVVRTAPRPRLPV